MLRLVADRVIILVECAECSEERRLLSDLDGLLTGNKRVNTRTFVPFQGGEIGIMISERG